MLGALRPGVEKWWSPGIEDSNIKINNNLMRVYISILSFYMSHNSLLIMCITWSTSYQNETDLAPDGQAIHHK